MHRDDAFVRNLAEIPLFAACSHRELERVARCADELHAEAGKHLTEEGATGHEFFVILAGTAEVTRDGHHLATLGPGDSFGELSLLDGAPRSATVTAQTEMDLAVIAQREFLALIDDVDGFARKLLAGLARRLREADGHRFH